MQIDPRAGRRWHWITLLVLAAGCSSRYRYEITIRPADEGVARSAGGAAAFERTITFWKSSGSNAAIQEFPKADLDRIAAAYGATAPAKLDQKHTFSRAFTGKMPAEIENSGTLSRWVSPFGTATLYMERFGGNDDVFGQFEKRKKAVDRLADLVIDWLESELGREPNWPKLRLFLDTDLRRDIQNLSALMLVASGEEDSLTMRPAKPESSSADAEETMLFRALQYLTERGYLEARDLPALVASMEDHGSLAMQWGERFLREKLELAENAPRPAGLAFLADSETLLQSLDRYLRATPEYKKLEEEWEARRKENPDEPQPEGADVLNEPFRDAFFSIRLFEDSTEVSVTLHCPVPPYATNGSWDQAKGAIHWNTLQNGDTGLPTFFFANWAEPNTKAQVARFGKEILVGQALGEYVLWYAGLGPDLAAEWDAFLASLEPGPDLVGRIETFRFKSDPAPAPDDAGLTVRGPSRAQGGIQPIIEGLKPNKLSSVEN